MGTRAQWVNSQPTVSGMSNADGPLVACLGDMVADTNNAGVMVEEGLVPIFGVSN